MQKGRVPVMTDPGARYRVGAQPCTAPRAQRGFSLLEILVAFAIAALSLGLLYQVSGNNARHAGGLVQQERAMLLAQSLLAAHQTIAPDGLQEAGEASGYAWQLSSRPHTTAIEGESPQATRLHELRVQVLWRDGERQRQFDLSTLRPERRLYPGEVIR